jgi:hypothetical protein
MGAELMLKMQWHSNHSKAERNKLWRMLMDGTGGSHSAQGVTLPYLINRLESEGIAYQLSAWPGQGYYLELIDRL